VPDFAPDGIYLFIGWVHRRPNTDAEIKPMNAKMKTSIGLEHLVID